MRRARFRVPGRIGYGQRLSVPLHEFRGQWLGVQKTHLEGWLAAVGRVHTRKSVCIYSSGPIPNSHRVSEHVPVFDNRPQEEAPDRSGPRDYRREFRVARSNGGASHVGDNATDVRSVLPTSCSVPEQTLQVQSASPNTFDRAVISRTTAACVVVVQSLRVLERPESASGPSQISKSKPRLLSTEPNTASIRACCER